MRGVVGCENTVYPNTHPPTKEIPTRITSSLNMSNIQMFDSPTSIIPSASTSSVSENTPRTLRERCGFTLSLSFAPAFPNLPAKGHVGPTAGNLPRRKRSSVTSIDLPAPVPAPADSNSSRAEYFGGDA
ncbi:hypothetical protein C8R44DRAFT_865594 [Mycena epipterygia]|nr:hypothetical protein C8R44DRAFT_865594 [Mycena epipterygia]